MEVGNILTSGGLPISHQTVFAIKVMAWGMMSYRAVSDLHRIPQSQTINAAYNCNNIMDQSLKDALSRK